MSLRNCISPHFIFFVHFFFASLFTYLLYLYSKLYTHHFLLFLLFPLLNYPFSSVFICLRPVHLYQFLASGVRRSLVLSFPAISSRLCLFHTRCFLFNSRYCHDNFIPPTNSIIFSIEEKPLF